MREIAGIVSGLVALRIVEEERTRRCEKFESGNWSELANKLSTEEKCRKN